MKRYISREKGTHPNDPSSFEFRENFAPDTATSAGEFKWRRERGKTQAIQLTLAYVGVWDTVKALGLPKFLPMAAAFNAQYTFHDDELSSSVMAARHAISIDERRITFPDLPWGNMDDLNGRYDDLVPRFAQQWFPGDHGSVGGGGPRIGLSSVAMHWVAQGAARAGLDLNWEEFDRVAHRLDPVDEKLTNKFGPSGLSGLLLNAIKKDRRGPVSLDEVSVATLDRLIDDPGYRPKTLDHIKSSILNRPATEVAAIRDWKVAKDAGPTHERGQHVRPRDWEPPQNAELPSDLDGSR